MRIEGLARAARSWKAAIKDRRSGPCQVWQQRSKVWPLSGLAAIKDRRSGPCQVWHHDEGLALTAHTTKVLPRQPPTAQGLAPTAPLSAPLPTDSPPRR